jgi:hypothetical protein
METKTFNVIFVFDYAFIIFICLGMLLLFFYILLLICLNFRADFALFGAVLH